MAAIYAPRDRTIAHHIPWPESGRGLQQGGRNPSKRYYVQMKVIVDGLATEYRDEGLPAGRQGSEHNFMSESDPWQFLKCGLI